MKSCPRCGQEYPDSEAFCETDGTALVAGASATSGRSTTVITDDLPAEEKVIECPVCGGKAQPGEVICNFCGTRLVAESGMPSRAASPTPGAKTRVSPETFVPVQERFEPHEMGSETRPRPTETYEEPSGGRRLVGIVGFSAAAIIALAAGAWLALYLSGRQAAPPIAQASPSPSPAAIVTGAPMVALAKTMPIQVQGDPTSARQRDPDSLRKVFDGSKDSITNAYKEALNSDRSLSDGMVVRLHIMPDGGVSDGSVRVSTASNPSLDGAIIKAMSGWKFAAASGTGVDADFPIIFAAKGSDASGLESDLNKKLASLGPNEAPEYAYAPSTTVASPSPAEAAATPPGIFPSPEVASAPATLPGIPPSPEVASAPDAISPAVAAPETSSAPAHGHKRRRLSEELASTAPPRHMGQPPLSDRVATELSASRKLRRVHAYTSGGVVTLTGKVFDDNDKILAERTARSVDGVISVTNNLTTDTQDWAQNQARITQQLQGAGLSGVTAKVIGHDVYLNGEVKTNQEREQAATIAQAAAPVKVRMNMIRVAPGSMFGF